MSSHTAQAVPASQWWQFSHWTVTPDENLLGPDMVTENGTSSVEVAGTVTANFTYIEHVELEVEIQPSGAGVALMDNTTLIDDYWTGEFVANSPTTFRAIANDPEFDRWIVETSEPTPNDRSTGDGPNSQDVDYESVNSNTEVEFRLFVPNAFTPDNDGVNDSFLPLGQGFVAEQYRFIVVNRWGEVVFDN